LQLEKAEMKLSLHSCFGKGNEKRDVSRPPSLLPELTKVLNKEKEKTHSHDSQQVLLTVSQKTDESQGEKKRNTAEQEVTPQASCC